MGNDFLQTFELDRKTFLSAVAKLFNLAGKCCVEVFDLLDLTSNTKTGLRVREHSLTGPYVDGLSKLAVLDAQEIEDLMTEGNKGLNKNIAALSDGISDVSPFHINLRR